jgi:hypothetical protein
MKCDIAKAVQIFLNTNNERVQNPLNVFLIVIYLLGLFMTNSIYAKDLVLTREVVIQREGAFPDKPNIITRANDGGFILAGRPWAIKTDSDGKVLWRYVRDKFRADYTGAVEMPDGTTYLCGNMYIPDAGKEYKPTILTHLDASGLLLNEQIIVPQKKTEHGLSYFDSCVGWGGGLAIVGHVSNAIRQASGTGSTFTMPVREDYYWFLKLDSSGKVQWEQHIPTTFNNIEGVRSLLVAPDSSLVFAGYRLDQTELFRVSITGDVVAKKLLPGYFQFLRPVVPDGMLKIFGGTNKLFVISTLDNQLEETHRVQGDQPSAFNADHLAYRMPDQSLVLFGENLHSSGEQYTSAVAHVDPTLQSAQKLEMVHEPYSDYFVINAATPTGKDGEFVIARALLKHQANEGRIGLERIGVVLDFIQTK